MNPLQGIRVLSLETWGSGAFHGELLAMLGAEVINIEDPRQAGNPLRTMGTLYLDKAGLDNEGNAFCLHNKRSLALDLREVEGKQPRSAHATQCPSQIYRTADGWVYIACLTQKFWDLLCQKPDRPDLAADPRFETNNLRLEHRDEPTKILDAVLMQHPTVFWTERLSGVIPYAPVLDIGQALENPFVTQNGKLIQVPYDRDPQRKEVTFIAPPFSFDGDLPVDYTLPPRFSQDSRDILLDLDYSEQETEDLRRTKVIC